LPAMSNNPNGEIPDGNERTAQVEDRTIPSPL
jgi:hypothetical protein